MRAEVVGRALRLARASATKKAPLIVPLSPQHAYTEKSSSTMCVIGTSIMSAEVKLIYLPIIF